MFNIAFILHKPTGTTFKQQMGKRNNASDKKPSKLLLLCQVKSSEDIDTTPPSSITDEAPTERLPRLQKSGKTGQGSKVSQKLMADMSLTEADKKKLSPIMSKRSNTNTNANNNKMDSDAVGRNPWAPKPRKYSRHVKLPLGGFCGVGRCTRYSTRKSCLPNLK
ncbi:hypothetical protein GQ42DRAFT_173507 [Ramicandelaber brevisporus]|nr:hypothetical protein GQ42DRAFT_173507 [Ramicandelaber brevisporus]